MTKCPACGAPIDENASACSQCGADLQGSTQSFAPVGVSEDAAPAHVADAEGPTLVVRKGREVGERFYLDNETTTIGRDPSSDIFLNDVTVSRHHATVMLSGGVATISDAGSLNGTYVNGVCVDKSDLNSGDSVQVGTFQMAFITGMGS